MTEREIDALLLTTESEVGYFSGFRSQFRESPSRRMVFAPGKLMVHEENIAITDGPAELLSRRAPPAMPVIS